jgi:hypothetical protein
MTAYDADPDAQVLAFAGSAPDEPHGREDTVHEDTVVVRRTQVSGPGGSPVEGDGTGCVRAEISDGEAGCRSAASTRTPGMVVLSEGGAGEIAEHAAVA